MTWYVDPDGNVYNRLPRGSDVPLRRVPVEPSPTPSAPTQAWSGRDTRAVVVLLVVLGIVFAVGVQALLTNHQYKVNIRRVGPQYRTELQPTVRVPSLPAAGSDHQRLLDATLEYQKQGRDMSDPTDVLNEALPLPPATGHRNVNGIR